MRYILAILKGFIRNVKEFSGELLKTTLGSPDYRDFTK
jgi:hypothetical protein